MSGRTELFLGRLLRIPSELWLLGGALLVGIYLGLHAPPKDTGAGGAQAAVASPPQVGSFIQAAAGVPAPQQSGTATAPPAGPSNPSVGTVTTPHNYIASRTPPVYNVLTPDSMYPYYRVKTIANQ